MMLRPMSLARDYGAFRPARAIMRQWLLGCASVVTLGMASPAFAADPEAPVATADNAVDEVIVVARRREENLQSVPVSVSAISQEDLQRRNITSYNDLQHLVPGLSVANGTGGRDEGYSAIRGTSGCETDCAAVVSYLNEVPLPPGPSGGTGGGGPGLFYDLDNVQVLKGPQGTLFGRNTMAGVILFQSKRPTNEFGGYLQGTLGNYEERGLAGALNIPLIDDKLLLRVAFNGENREGYTKVAATPGHPGGRDLDDRNYIAARVSLSYRPNDQIQNDLIYDGIINRNHGTGYILAEVDSNGIGAAIFPSLLDLFQEQQELGVRNQAGLDVTPFSNSAFDSLTNITKVDLTPDITFRNIVSYSVYTNDLGLDGDGTVLPLFNVPYSSVRYRVVQYTEEPQLLGKSFDGKLDWVAGAFFLKQPAQPYALNYSTVFGGDSLGTSRRSNHSEAVYAQGTYNLEQFVSGLKVTGGLRYSWDHPYAEGQSLDVDGTCGGSADLAPCTTVGRGGFSALSWTLGVDYQVTPDTLLYLASRRGYHSGGFNPAAPPGDTANGTYDPEYIIDQELGVKSDWTLAGMRGRTNLALYHQNYTDIQTLVLVPLPTNPSNQYIKNAGEARVWGVDLDGWIRPVRGLELSANFAWLDFSYTDVAPGVDLDSLKFNVPARGPKYKYGVGARYTLPVDSSLGEISVSADWTWQTRTGLIIVIPGDPLATIPPYGLLNLSAEWTNIGGRPIDASFFATNVTNKTYTAGGYALNPGIGFSVITYGEPRIVGFRLRYHFGGES